MMKPIDYYSEAADIRPMEITLTDGRTIEGKFSQFRLRPETLPKGKRQYQIRHCDEDDMEAGSIKNGIVSVNFFGTFVCKPIPNFAEGEELDIEDWTYID